MVKLHLVSILDSKQTFQHYIDLTNQTFREESDSKSCYLRLMAKYCEAKNYKDLFADDSYMRLAYRTLEEWNMNQRGARLVDLSEFKQSILQNEDSLEELSKYRLELVKWGELLRTVFPLLKPLFNDMRIMNSGARIVGVSKALHFLLPNLVMPIDRTYTLNFFYLGSGYSQNPEKEFRYFKEVFEEYVKVVQDLGLSAQDVDHIGWNTSIPKMIDNALIGIAIHVDRQIKAGNQVSK